MPRKPIVVRINAADVPRDTLVTMLTRSRNGRGKQSMLTKTPRDGYYFAVIDHPETAVTFQVALTTLSIRHDEANLDAAGIRIQATPATASSASEARKGSGANSGRRVWTGDPAVDAAISAWMVDLFTPRDLFGRPRTNASS